MAGSGTSLYAPAMRRTALLVLVLGMVVPAAPAHAADTVHTGAYWSWTGPESWDDAQGVYGITVLGDKKATYDLGFSSIFCADGASWDESVKNYFKGKRQQLKDNGLALSNVSKIKAVGGDYRRQTMNVAQNGTGGVKGVVVLDYDFTTTVDGVNYCYQRSESRTAAKSAYKELKGKLAKVGNTLAYFGPGAYEDE